MTTFNEDVSELNWESIDQLENVSDAYSTFEDMFKKVIDKHAPLRRSRIKKKESPWINDEIIRATRDRNEAKRKARKTKSQDDWMIYRILRNNVTEKIRNAKKGYISDLIKGSNGNSSQIWKSLSYATKQLL